MPLVPRRPLPSRSTGHPVPKTRTKTKEFRRWTRLNIVDARAAIDDDELAWSENALIIGNGSIQILPGVGASVATVAAGIASLWGFTLNGTALFLSINTDGSMSQITTGGVVTAVAPAGSVTTAAHATIWQGTRILVVDPTRGYSSWDGALWAVIDAAKTGTTLAVFEGRVWIANNRTITFTAPNTYNDFTAGNGAGSTIVTDEAFRGNIVELVSALEELWIVGASDVEAISNVTASGVAPSVVTTFSITNIVAGLGAVSGTATLAYFRALAMVAPFGVYALSGVTPQKLSEKLDGLFPSLTLGSAPMALAVVQGLPCLLVLATFTGQNLLNPGAAMQAGGAPRPVLLGFSQGKWFLAAQGALTWITTVVVNGTLQAWGTDGTHIMQCFGAALTSAVTYKVQTKLWDFGSSNVMKVASKVALEFTATQPIAPTVTLDSEVSSVPVSLTFVNALTLINNAAAALQLQNALAANLNLVSQGLVLARGSTTQFGFYLGLTIAGTDPPYRIQAVALEVTPTREELRQ